MELLVIAAMCAGLFFYGNYRFLYRHLDEAGCDRELKILNDTMRKLIDLRPTFRTDSEEEMLLDTHMRYTSKKRDRVIRRKLELQVQCAHR
jgi:hypothetical protein